MYVPYVRSRFGEMTHFRSLSDIEATMRRGFLLQVFEKDIWVSAMVCRVRDKEVTLLAPGLIPDYMYYLKRGALTAAYFFSLKWAENQSMRVVDLLRSRPHRENGVYKYKRYWGAVPSKDCWPHTSLSFFWNKSSPIVGPLRNQLVWHAGKFRALASVAEPL